MRRPSDFGGGKGLADVEDDEDEQMESGVEDSKHQPSKPSQVSADSHSGSSKVGLA